MLGNFIRHPREEIQEVVRDVCMSGFREEVQDARRARHIWEWSA